MRLIQLNEYQKERKSILFLNGGGQIHLTKYQKIVRYFEDRPYNLISVELPGHGKSSFDKVLTEDEYIDHFKTEFRNIIDEKEVQVYLMLGFSLGGLLTLKTVQLQLFPIEKVIVYGCGFGVDEPELPMFKYYISEQFFIDQKWMPIMIKNHGDGWKNLLLSLKNFLDPSSKVFTTPQKLIGTEITLILGEEDEIFGYKYNYELCKNTEISVEQIPQISHFEYTTKGWKHFKEILDQFDF